MKSLNSIKKITLVTLLGAMLALGSGISNAHAVETNPDGYEVPDLTGYLKAPKEPMVDASKEDDGVKETRVQLWYKDHEGSRDKVFKYMKRDTVWAYGVKKSGEQSYAIVDSDCDGDYDEKYGGKEYFNIPSCLET